MDIILGAVCVAGTVLAVLAIYVVSRVLLLRWSEDATETLAGSVIFRISALHGLILALVFAQELGQYGELRLALTEEASAVADIWNDMDRYGGPERERVQTALSAYVREVVGTEWDRLGDGLGLSSVAWSQWEVAYQGVLSLEPETAREVALHDHMLTRVHEISRLRDLRETEALYGLSGVFWLAAVAGVVLVVVPYFTFAPSVLHLLLLGIYGAYTGLVMHLIYAFSDPYEQPARLPPAAFERLMEGPVGAG